jgi:hypothetical protein
MNLLISEVQPVDAVLDRAIPWLDNLNEYLSSPLADDESQDHPGRIVSSPEPAWYELRLSMLRQAIMDAF